MSNGRMVTGEAGTAGRDRFLPQPRRADLDLPTVLGALADPTRLALVRALVDNDDGELTCGFVGDRLHIGPSTLSHHLKVLREAGVTSTQVLGRRRAVTVRRDDLAARFPGLLDVVLAG